VTLLARVVLIVAAALLPPLMMQAFNESVLRTARQDELRQETLRDARTLAAELDAIVAGVRNALVATAAIPAIRAADAASCEPLLQAVFSDLAFLRGMLLVGDDGRVVCATDPAADGARLDRAPEVRLAWARGGPALGGYTQAPDGVAVLPVAYPVRGLPGRGPVLIGQIDLGWMRARLADGLLPQGAAVTLADRDGAVLIALPDADRAGRALHAGARFVATLPPGSGVLDMQVSLALDPAPVLAAAAAASARGYALIGAGFLAAMALAAWMARGIITRPVHAILDATERWQAGDTGARLPARPGRSEFGRIAAAVNALLDAVATGQATLRATLEGANAELERRVAERTRQLEVEVREREAAQAQLQQAQKMEVIGQLTGGIAHDFNNLLTAIVGNLELAAGRSRDRPEVVRLLTGAMRSADRGAALTQRMLAFGRRQYLCIQPVSLRALLDGMAEMIARTIGPAIEVRIDAPENLWPARADPNQVELVVLNLVVNARDAMPEGGCIVIAAAAERVGAAPPAGLEPGEYVRLSVSDTGEGMDAETADRAFEPFFTTKPVGRGSGLGLSMVQGVVAQSGGAVLLRSAPGAGTTVTVWLPRAVQAAAPRAGRGEDAPDAGGAGRCILLVDDDPDVAAFAATCLAEAGYTVASCDSGAAALARLRTLPPPDLLIADVGMPGMSGLELATAARQLHPRLPILIATGYAAEDGDIGNAIDLPVLGKPFKAADLLGRVAALLVAPTPDDAPHAGDGPDRAPSAPRSLADAR
jgi:signal transduction histidine kinase/ActR/RegA family two-component response regulator